MFEPSEVAWHNGTLVERERAAPSIASQSFHLGIGVFDGMMAYWNDGHFYVHRARDHVRRLLSGTSNMGLELRWSEEELLQAIDSLLDALPPKTYYVRPIAYRGGPQINITDAAETPTDLAIFCVTAGRGDPKSLRCNTSSVQRLSASAIPVHWKVCGAYVNSYLARREAQAQGFDDGIMLDAKGRLTEASAANLFLIRDETLTAPKMTPDIFPGITRATLLELASELGIGVIERILRPDDLQQYDGAFLVSTLWEMKPLSAIDSIEYNTTDHPIFRTLWSAFSEMTCR